MIILYAMTHALNNNYNLYNIQYNDNASFYTLCIFNYMLYKCFILYSLHAQLHVSNNVL